MGCKEDLNGVFILLSTTWMSYFGCYEGVLTLVLRPEHSMGGGTADTTRMCSRSCLLLAE